MDIEPWIPYKCALIAGMCKGVGPSQRTDQYGPAYFNCGERIISVHLWHLQNSTFLHKNNSALLGIR